MKLCPAHNDYRDGNIMVIPQECDVCNLRLPMTVDEAVEWLVKRAEHNDDCAKGGIRPIGAPEPPCSCGGDAALAALEGPSGKLFEPRRSWFHRLVDRMRGK